MADHYRVLDPDYPGFGHSSMPRDEFAYTFDNLAGVVEKPRQRTLRRQVRVKNEKEKPTDWNLAVATDWMETVDKVSEIVKV